MKCEIEKQFYKEIMHNIPQPTDAPPLLPPMPPVLMLLEIKNDAKLNFASYTKFRGTHTRARTHTHTHKHAKTNR